MASLDYLNSLLSALPQSNVVGTSTGMIWDIFQHSLKEEAKERLGVSTFLDLRIQDIALDKLEKFKVDFREYFSEVTKKKTYNRFLEDLKRNYPNRTIDDLKEKKRDAVMLAIEDFATKSAGFKLKALISGNTLREALEKKVNGNVNFSIGPQDFSRSNSKDNGAVDRQLSQEEQQSLKKNVMRSTLKAHSLKNDNIKAIDLFFSEIRTFETVYCHVLQLKLFKKISQDSIKSINQILPTDYEKYTELTAKLLKEEKNRQERKANRIADELIRSESQAKAALQKKKNKQKAKDENNSSNSTSQQDSSETNSNDNSKTSSVSFSKEETVNLLSPEQLARLNKSAHSELIPLRRVTRWRTADLSIVREFWDFDSTTGTWVQNYKNYDNETLINLMSNHNLTGIERLCSDQKILENYTFSYSFWDSKGLEKKCRGFYAIKAFDKQTEHGIVNVGIGNDGVIYHAMFEPLQDKELCPQNLVRAFETSEGQPNSVIDEKWQPTSRSSFFVDEDGAIQMDIFSGRFPTLTYKFYPLT